MTSRARGCRGPSKLNRLKRTRGSRPVADDASPRRLVGGHGPNHGRRAGTAPVAPHRRRDADRSKTGSRSDQSPAARDGYVCADCCACSSRARLSSLETPRSRRPPGSHEEPHAHPGSSVPASGPCTAGRSAAHAPSRATPVICAFAVRCRREQADGIPVAETGMPNFDSGYDLRPGYGSKHQGSYKVARLREGTR